MRNRNYKRKRTKAVRRCSMILAIVIVAGILFSGAGFLMGNTGSLPFIQNNPLQAGRPQGAAIKNVEVKSTHAILINMQDETVLYDKNSNERVYPASLTKIMTAVVALENLGDLNAQVYLDSEVFYYITSASMAGFESGEWVRAIDLLYGLLLPSGAECAVGLANYVAGSEEAFAVLMNDTAKKLGMANTNFTNATGLHHNENYSTAKDLAILFQYAVNNDVFYNIITTPQHMAAPTNLHESGIAYSSTLFSKINSASFGGGTILGGKTGYTDEAGQCLASFAEKNGQQYVLVTCGARGDIWTETLHIDDAFTLYTAIP